jgi:hypothetical protein
MAIQFGIISCADTYGLATSVERSQSVEEATYSDADGDVAGYSAYNKAEEVTIEATYESTTPVPTIGASVSLTVGGVTKFYLVTGIKDTETNDDYRKVSITAKRWMTNTIPAS